jgi:hypothetical protein
MLYANSYIERARINSIRVLSFFLIFFSFAKCIAQKENNIWMLGNQQPNNNCGIDFNSGNPDTFSLTRNMDFFLLNASICDTSGMLLFYTNGQYIANRNHDTLLNSRDFNPGWLTDYYSPYGMGLPQGAFIIPRPNHYGQYFVFHESGELCDVSGRIVSQPIHLSCSMVDMSLDGGLGGVDPLFKNRFVINDTLIYGRMTGTRHANGRDWWVVVHRSDSDLYYKLLITPDSIYGPYSQNIGRQDHWEKFTQECTFSPDGSKYAMMLTVDTSTLYNIIDLFDFDRCTGLFSNPREVIVPDSFLLYAGCSFSPNSRFLYVSNQIEIYQYDTWDSSMNANVRLVAQWDSFVSPLKTKFYSHQLAPDGKIYISTSEGSNVFHYIENPDLQGLVCNVVQNSFFLPTINNVCMPNSPNFSLGAMTGSICDSLSNGINQLNSTVDLIEIYPNPFIDELNFKLLFPLKTKLKILNSLGEEIFNRQLFESESIDFSHLPQGSYFLELVSEKGIQRTKVIKMGY